MSQVNQVKSATDIVEIIGQRLDLKQSGSSLKTLCPFHSEKSPSFFVSSQLQRYRCFGCGASGDVFEFLERYEGMSFYEALQFLADEAGIELKKYAKTQDDEIREQLQEVLKLSARYYHYLLTEHKAGEQARHYLKKRGIIKQSIELFKLGCALPAWDGLLNYLTKKKKYQPQLVEKSGLIIKNRSGRYYDRFRNRIVFPLKNHRGQVVGFSGRILKNIEGENKQPKYINTPETLLYHKSETLYGYSELFQHIRQQNEVIVCEGEFDVISSFQAHVKHVCAIKGSALTDKQAKLLERTVEKVILSLDSDEAGIKATQRAIQVVKDTNLDLRVIDLSSDELSLKYQDADDMASKDPTLWRKLAKSSISAYEFLINNVIKKHNLNSASGRRKIINEVAPLLSTISHEVEKDYYLKRLADRLNVSTSILRQDIEKFGQSKQAVGHQRKQNKQDENKQASVEDPTRQLEDYLLFLLFNSDNEWLYNRAVELVKFELVQPEAQQILELIVKNKVKGGVDDLVSTLAEDLKAMMMEWQNNPTYLSNFQVVNLQKEWDKALSNYQKQQASEKIAQLHKRIAELESEKSESNKKEVERIEHKIQELLQKIVDLQHRLKS